MQYHGLYQTGETSISPQQFSQAGKFKKGESPVKKGDKDSQKGAKKSDEHG
jgi:hypothetical protein